MQTTRTITIYDINNNNERLEFLGDAILNSIVSEQLFFKNNNKEEGFLSQKRAIIVSKKDVDKEILINEIKGNNSYSKYLENKKIKRSIYIKDRLINLILA